MQVTFEPVGPKPGCKITLRFKRGHNPKTGAPQWESRADGILYLVYRDDRAPTNDGENWMCMIRFFITQTIAAVTLEQQVQSQTQRRKEHRRAMHKAA